MEQGINKFKVIRVVIQIQIWLLVLYVGGRIFEVLITGERMRELLPPFLGGILLSGRMMGIDRLILFGFRGEPILLTALSYFFTFLFLIILPTAISTYFGLKALESSNPRRVLGVMLTKSFWITLVCLTVGIGIFMTMMAR